MDKHAEEVRKNKELKEEASSLPTLYLATTGEGSFASCGSLSLHLSLSLMQPGYQWLPDGTKHGIYVVLSPNTYRARVQ
ncbi:Stathmin-4 [Manis pentadactyla]|nr:Stathmin-4 [Manis pentadactyla]